MVEVLVATVLLAVGITAGVRALGAMAQASAAAADRSVAVRIAGERLALLEAAVEAEPGALGVELADAEGEYSADPRFRWRQRVTTSTEPGLLEVTITVTWYQGLLERRYAVMTYLLEPAQPAEE